VAQSESYHYWLLYDESPYNLLLSCCKARVPRTHPLPTHASKPIPITHPFTHGYGWVLGTHCWIKRFLVAIGHNNRNPFGHHSYVLIEFSCHWMTPIKFNCHQTMVMNFSCPWWIYWHFQLLCRNHQMSTKCFSIVQWQSILENVFEGIWVLKCNFWFEHLYSHLSFVFLVTLLQPLHGTLGELKWWNLWWRAMVFAFCENYGTH
jgi:hypothetical protein